MREFFRALFPKALGLLIPIMLCTVTACNSGKRADFYRYYSPYDGSCTEYMGHNDDKVSIRYEETNLARLFNKYPEAKGPADSVKTGAYFYFSTKEDSAFGAGAGDYAERAAFLLLEMDDVYAKGNAVLIRMYLIQDDMNKMRDLFEQICDACGVKEEMVFEDGKSGVPMMLRDYKIDSSGKKVPHGLTRLYHENGMIAGDTYYRNGKQEKDFAHTYNTDCSAAQ